ncbi:DUF4123 domain-containing protein [Trinickia sp. LjRoot230]|uniref:DUF4123 domain-containing protein n=1 Tax=Trinickia sp. LjRoot230 TaxID=3342288 RepID=UPI003ECF3234
MIHYVIVEPLNGKLELSNVPPVYEVGELVPEARPELAGAVPVLYCAEHPGEQLPALRGQAEQRHASGAPPVICAILECDKAGHRLQRHLAERLVLPKPTEGTAIFRFYDPRVFAHLQWILKPEQLGALMGPAARWTYLDGGGEWVTVKGAETQNEGLAVSQNQYGQITRIELVERVLSILRVRSFALKADTPRWVEAHLARGEAYGLEGNDLVGFAVHGVKTSPYFDRHPRVQAVLTMRGKTSYMAAVQNWDVHEWTAIARESAQYQ